MILSVFLSGKSAYDCVKSLQRLFLLNYYVTEHGLLNFWQLCLLL